MTGPSCNSRLQGFLAHEKTPLSRDPTVSICVGPYGGPMGSAVSYERGTPVGRARLEAAHVLLTLAFSSHGTAPCQDGICFLCWRT